MRPLVPELLRGLSIALLADVVPELESGWAQAEVRSTAGILETVAVEWDAAADLLVRENAELQRVVHLAIALVHEQSVELPQRLVLSLNSVAELEPPGDLRISTLQTRNDVLWTGVIPMLELLARDELAEATGARFKEELQPLLRAYVAARRLRRRS